MLTPRSANSTRHGFFVVSGVSSEYDRPQRSSQHYQYCFMKFESGELVEGSVRPFHLWYVAEARQGNIFIYIFSGGEAL